MSAISWDHLQTPYVTIERGASTQELLHKLSRIGRGARGGTLVIVEGNAGDFVTFSLIDLAKALTAAGDASFGMSLDELLPYVETVVSPSVVRTEVGIGEATDRQSRAPMGRLVVVENGQPVGVLVDFQLSGEDADTLGRFEDRFLDVAEANGGDTTSAEPPEPGAEPEPEESAPPEPGAVPRRLSARVHAGLEERKCSFKAGADHQITIGISPPDRDLIQAEEAFPHEVPAGEEHILDVVLWAPGLLDAPAWRTLRLPATGPTPEPATFPLHVPPDVDRVAATIGVLYQRRTVQVATLRGQVVSGADATAPADARIELGTAPVTSLDLSGLRPFDASLVVNGDDVLGIVAGGSRHFTLGGIDASVKEIQGQLYNTAVAAAREDGGLDSQPVRDLLYVLAFHGNAIYRELTKGELASMAAATTVEVTVRNAADFFPVELVYERGWPAANPQICPNWEDAFANGTPCPACPAAVDGSAYVCPLGFWGLSKEIARRIETDLPEDELAAATLSRRSSDHPRLLPLRGGLIGASANVDAAVRGQVAATLELANTILVPDGAITVDDWKDWKSAVENRRPPLLLAMPHTEHDSKTGVDFLRIGAKSDLNPLAVDGQYVQVPFGKVGPIVLLLGCSTAAPEIGYLGFVPRFLDRHAAVVVGTIAKVLGRHTAPAARQFLEIAVAAQGSDLRMSEVMRRTRGATLRAGNVMGLTLAAYGNADWLL
jgi:hypothetical protein